MKSERLCLWLEQMIEAAGLACSYVEEMDFATFESDRRTQQAVVLNLLLLGEIAAKFMEIVEEVGLPAGVINFISGSAKTGEAMVTHPKTRFISFTGSKGVGLHINEEAAKTRDGQIWIKRVIAEMGGKDAIVVADDADLDAAASGAVF